MRDEKRVKELQAEGRSKGEQRTRLAVHLVVYRTEEEWNGSEWEELDCDATAELALEEGVIERAGERDEQEEQRLQQFADRVANAR